MVWDKAMDLEKRRRYIKLFNIAGNVNTNHFEGERWWRSSEIYEY